MIRYPAVRFTLAFMAGILLNEYFIFNFFYLIIIVSLLLFTFIFSILIHKPPNNPVSIAVLYLLIAAAGSFNAEVNKEQMNLMPAEIIRQEGFTVYGTITEPDLLRDDRITFILQADSFSYENVIFRGSVKLRGELRIENNIVRDSLYAIILPGNEIIQKGLFFKGKGKRNPGEFDYNKYLRSKNISGILRSTAPSDLFISPSEKNTISTFIFRTRRSIDDQIKELHTPVTASLLRGLLLADRSGIDYKAKEEFINAGVMHVLAVSGLHTAYIALIFLILFGRFNLALRSILTAAGLISFLLITGMQVSVFRSVVMGILIITAVLSNRSTNIFNSLAAAALIILIAAPEEIYNPGFQLSFSAVLSIAIIYPVMRRLLPPRLDNHPYIRGLVLFATVSTAAQIGTLPVTIYYFGKLSLISIAANMLIIPLVGIIISTALITLIVSLFAPYLSLYFGAANELFTIMIFKSVSTASNILLSFFRINNFSAVDVILAYLFIVYFFFTVGRTGRKGSLILFLLILFNISLFASFDDREFLPEGKLSVMMIDVGQGDAFLIGTPGGKTILIDAGQADKTFDQGERVVIPLLNHLNIDQIDFAFITHLDLDHYGGIISLVHDKRIKHLFKPPRDYSSADEKLEVFLRAIGQSFSYYDRDIISIDDMRIYVLNDYRAGSRLGGNDGSGVLKISYGKTSFLFTGDIHSAGEKYYIMEYDSFLSSDVLKVSHHGSKSSTSEEFIKFADPDFAFISAGYKNRFNHPSTEVLERLTYSGIEILRTDLGGAVLLQSDGRIVNQVDWDY